MKRGPFSRSEKVFYVAGMIQIWAGVALAIWGIISLGFGILVATLGMLGMSRVYRDRSQYNAGWMAGRMRMFSSLGEAQARGLHPIEWMIGECERDGIQVTFHEGEPD